MLSWFMMKAQRMGEPWLYLGEEGAGLRVPSN